MGSDERDDSRELYKSDLERHLYEFRDEGRELDEAIEAIIDKLEALPEKFREVFLLREGGKLTFEQIAEKLTMPLETVKERFGKARQLLQNEPDADGSEAAG